MPQRSYPYAVTRVRAMETRMLDASRFARLGETTESEGLRLLAEWGYAPGGGLEEQIAAQLAETRKIIWDITPDAAVTGLFLLPIDAHNLKALLKARLLGVEPDGTLLGGGLFDAAVLQKCVHDRDYKDLPEGLARDMAGVERLIAHNPDPRLFSALVDRAVFSHRFAVLKKHPNEFALGYFRAQADFVNVRSALRARFLKWEGDKLAPMLVEGGELPEQAFTEALGLPDEALPKKLGQGANGAAIARALEEYAKKPDTVALERKFDKALMDKMRAGKGDTFSLSPVVGYLAGREAEAKALRVLFAAKRAGVAAELPALYS